MASSPRQRRLGAAISTCRQAAGLTQEQLGRRLQVNRTTVIDMEAGRNRALTRAAEAFSVLGYDLLVVPRGAKVTVTEAPSHENAAPASQQR